MRRTHVRRIGLPQQTRVQAGPDGVPVSVAGRLVSELRDEWRVDEGWWSGHRLRRRYFELVLADGRNAVVYYDHASGRWYGQRA
jgi:hypothetical protein